MTTFNPWVVTCSSGGCGHKELDERHVTVWSKVEGWEKKRDAGGTNHVALRKPLGVFMCAGCMDLLRAGLDPSIRVGEPGAGELGG